MGTTSGDNDMSDGRLLAIMGTDAQKWAQEWCKVAVDLGNAGHEVVDEGWMIGWFANAIEAGRAAGRKEGHDDATSGDRP